MSIQEACIDVKIAKWAERFQCTNRIYFGANTTKILGYVIMNNKRSKRTVRIEACYFRVMSELQDHVRTVKLFQGHVRTEICYFRSMLELRYVTSGPC